MCLLIAKPIGVAFPSNLEEMCKNAARSNGDGMGFATGNGWMKSPNINASTFAKLLDENVDIREPCIVHFRLSTSGGVSRENCHPFKLPDGTFFAHNGVCASKYTPSGGRCDTRVLAESCNTYDELWAACLELVNGYNKFALINPHRIKNDKGIDIIGEHLGSWENGIWFSNSSWKNTTYYSGASSHSYYQPHWTREDYIPSSTELSVTPKSVTAQIADLVNTYGYNTVQQSLAKVKTWTSADISC